MTRAPALAVADRRWERRPDDRPRVLMVSALKLLRRDGYRRVRVADIARDAGVCKATVYHYFANKDDLLTRSVASRMAERHREIEQRIARSGGRASARLRLFLEELWAHSQTPQYGLWQRMIVGEMVDEAPEVFAAWAQGLVRQWRFAERLIRQGQADGEFRRGVDAAVTARLMVSGLAHEALFHMHLGLSRFAPCSLDRLFRSSLDLFLNGLRAPAPRASRRLS